MSPIYVLFILLIYTSVMWNTISKCNLKHMYISAHENFKPCVLFQHNHGNERIYMYSEIITSIPIGSSHLHTWLCLLHKYQKVTCQTCDVFQFYKRELRKIEAFSKKFKYCTKFHFLWMLMSHLDTVNGVNKTVYFAYSWYMSHVCK